MIADEFFGSTGTESGNSPFDKGRTATHEFGNWLDLFHVFQHGCDDNWNYATHGDCCCDTPPQDTAYYKCKTNKNSCHGDNPDEKDPIRNFMGYSDDKCMQEFTECQKGRMNHALETLRPTAYFTSGDCPHFRFAAIPTQTQPPPFILKAFPNPFSINTALRLVVTNGEIPIEVTILDMQGKSVSTLLDNEIVKIGLHEYTFAPNVPGMYIA